MSIDDNIDNIDFIDNIIAKYVKTNLSNKNKDKNSLSYLVDKILSQSDCIRLGNELENILKYIIIHKNNTLTNIKQKNKKGVKEKDHLFKDDINKIIFYAEIKSNLNLDTEKSISTINKCIEIQKELEKNYPEYKIKWFLVGARYYSKEIIPRNIYIKYLKIKDNIVGINEYFQNMSISTIFDDNNYKIFINKIVAQMFV